MSDCKIKAKGDMIDAHLGRRGVECFEIQSFLKDGSVSKLYSVKSKHNDVYYTMEVANTSEDHLTRIAMALPPATPLSRHFTRIRYYFSTKSKLFVVLDDIAANTRSLALVFTSCEFFKENTVVFITAHLAAALMELHAHGKAYGQLCLENVLLRDDGSIMMKRTYFGTTYWIDKECIEGFCSNGSCDHVSCDHMAYEEKFDWICLGALICILLTGKTPFGSTYEEYAAVSDYLRPLLDDQSTPYCLPIALSNVACDLISKLLDGKTASEDYLQSHSFFNGVDWKKMFNFTQHEAPRELRREKHKSNTQSSSFGPNDSQAGFKTDKNTHRSHSTRSAISNTKHQPKKTKSLSQKISETERILRSTKKRLPFDCEATQSHLFRDKYRSTEATDVESLPLTREFLHDSNLSLPSVGRHSSNSSMVSEGVIHVDVIQSKSVKSKGLSTAQKNAQDLSNSSVYRSPTKKEVQSRLYERSDVLRNILSKYGFDDNETEIKTESDNELWTAFGASKKSEAPSRTKNSYLELSSVVTGNQSISSLSSAKDLWSGCESDGRYLMNTGLAHPDNEIKAVHERRGESLCRRERLSAIAVDELQKRVGECQSGKIKKKRSREASEAVGECGRNVLAEGTVHRSQGEASIAAIEQYSLADQFNTEPIAEISWIIDVEQNGFVDAKKIKGAGNPPSLQLEANGSCCPLDMVVNSTEAVELPAPSPSGYIVHGRSGSFNCPPTNMTLTAGDALFSPLPSSASAGSYLSRGRSTSLMTPSTNSTTTELMDKLRALGQLSYGRKLSPRLSSSTASLPRSPRFRHKQFHIGDMKDSLNGSDLDVSLNSLNHYEKPTPLHLPSNGVDEIQESIIKRSQLYRTASAMRNLREKTSLTRSFSAGYPVVTKAVSPGQSELAVERLSDEQPIEKKPETPSPPKATTPVSKPKAEKHSTANSSDPPKQVSSGRRKLSFIFDRNNNSSKNQRRHSKVDGVIFESNCSLGRSDTNGESSIWKPRMPMRRRSVSGVSECKACGKAMSHSERKHMKDLMCNKCHGVRTERKEAIMELIHTEVNFGEDLWILKEEFQVPMRTGGILSPEQLTSVFVNLQELIDVNSKLCATVQDGLQDCLAKGDQEFLTLEVGKVFLDNVEFLQAFEQFCSKQHQAIALIESLQKKSEILRVFLNVSRKENTKLRKMDLKSFLAMPVQRIMKYPLLLNRIYKATPADHNDRESIRHAQKRIEELISNTNDISKGKQPKLRKSRSTNTLHRADSSDKKQLIKTISEVLNWKTEETQIVLNTSFEVVHADLVGCEDLSKIRAKKPIKIQALLCLRGVEEDFDIEASDPSISPETSDAIVVLLKKKVANKFSVFKDPISLRECVLSSHERINTAFELLAMNSDPLTFLSVNMEEVSRWRHTLFWLIEDLAAWRFRRNAMANIMLKSLS